MWTIILTLYNQVLLQTAQNFLQGLYPPLASQNSPLATEKLTNGTEIESPLNGYQFIQIHGESEEEPETIWIKGDDNCPSYEDASESYKESTEYIQTLDSSKAFYSRFIPQLRDIMGLENVNYAHAYDVFDLLNVGSIHNQSIADAITIDELTQLRYYANQWEWGSNYNQTQADRSIGGMALAGGILRHLNETVSGKGKLKFSLMTGSYDTFLAFFGLTSLTSASSNFMGLPNYGASMAFELFTTENTTSFPSNLDDLNVRFLFRNGTDSSEQLTAFPLFGQQETSLKYTDFATKLNSLAITSVGQWCTRCASTASFCGASDDTTPSQTTGVDDGSRSGLTNVQAGVVGAMVTLAVIGLCGVLFWLLKRRRSALGVTAIPATKERRGSETDGSTSV